jgi:hypothetical protein
MGSGTFYSGAITDDGHRTATDYLTANNVIWWGTASYLGSFLRFESVNIPQGATITSAKLHMRCETSVSAGTGSADIYCCDADDQAAVANSDEAAFDALPLTTEKTNWPAASFLAGTWYDSPDIAAAVQEVVDRVGWASGNHLAVVIKDIDTSNAKRFHSRDSTSGTYKPELIITWSGETIEDVAGGTVGHSGTVVGTRLRENLAGGQGASGTAQGINLSEYLFPSMGAHGAAGRAGSVFNSPAASSEKGDHGIVTGVRLREPASAGSGFHGSIETLRWRFRTCSGEGGFSGTAVGFNLSSWLRRNRKKIIRRYVCVLTGDADGQDDLTIPIRSFQARMKQALPTFLSVVIPGLGYATGINLRTNGDLVLYGVYYVNGVAELTQQIVAVDLGPIRVDPGSKNSSITLSGHRTETFPTKITTLDGVNYRSVEEGEYRVRCLPDVFARPGDTAKYGVDEFEIETISFFVAEKQEIMEVQGQ